MIHELVSYCDASHDTYRMTHA
eukprot:SAG31_NODE_8244_length_1490_cov_2.249461_3_plen_21_part_01